ncbi:MAG: putative metal-binding motif-containing protein, partial [Myxococcota bacterium]
MSFQLLRSPCICTVALLLSCTLMGVGSDATAQTRRDGGDAIVAPAIEFTGHADVDFTEDDGTTPRTGVVYVEDPSIGRDVGLPEQAPAGTISGWDMRGVWLRYDLSADTLYVGIETWGIGGDADGNGIEGDPLGVIGPGTSDWLDANGGKDFLGFGSTESFALMIDTDGDGAFDVVAGVSATGDVADFTVAEFDGLPESPSTSFGTPLPGHVGAVHGFTDATAPHVEFSITHFSQLPGFGGVVGPISLQTFMGSLSDDGIGEDVVPNGLAAVEVCFDKDEDGFTECEGDCDDEDPDVHPAVDGDWVCDGVDADCDGETDEDFAGIGFPTTCGADPECMAEGQMICVDGTLIDTCTPGESWDPVPTECGQGVCASTGQQVCDPDTGELVDTCEAGEPSGADDDCDTVDDDCDGQTDEGYVAQETSCGVGACAAVGFTTCEAGTIGDSCEAGEPTGDDANCDGVDDDCDGATDEDYQPEATSCGVGACAATGETQCVAGDIVDTCEPGAPARADSCDGVDDDCDGQTDEDFAPQATTCGVGACAASGTTSCVDGEVVDTCTPGAPARGDICDGLDNDCDGQVDEDFAPQATTCGVGVCADTGTTSCVDGEVVDTCTPGAPARGDICDGLDNDCDGRVDEDFAPQATSCGVGACAATGETQCVGGDVVDTCEAGAPAGSDATCDGVDDDCDGTTDEDYAPEETSCGTGACASTGTTSCVAGEV